MNYLFDFSKLFAEFCGEHKMLATIFFISAMSTYQYTVDIIKFSISRKNKVNGGIK